jgi:hypothetical protein
MHALFVCLEFGIWLDMSLVVLQKNDEPYLLLHLFLFLKKHPIHPPHLSNSHTTVV